MTHPKPREKKKTGGQKISGGGSKFEGGGAQNLRGGGSKFAPPTPGKPLKILASFFLSMNYDKTILINHFS